MNILFKLLEGQYGITSEYEVCRNTSYNAIQAYGYYTNSNQYYDLWEKISQYTNPSLIQKYNEYETNVYNTKEGILYEEVDYFSTLNESSSENIPKENDNMFLSEKARQKQIDMEIKRLKALEEKKKKEAIERAEKLKSQTELRNEMKIIVDPFISYIKGFLSLCKSNPSGCLKIYQLYKDYLIGWLKHPLSRPYALEIAQHLIKALPNPISDNSYDISLCILESLLNPGLDENLELMSNIGDIIEKGLDNLLKSKIISLESVSFLSIIFNNVSLYNPPLPYISSIVTLYEEVINISLSNDDYSQGMSHIRGDMMMTLIHLYEIAPEIKPSISDLLLKLTKSQQINDNDLEAIKYGCLSEQDHVRNVIIEIIKNSEGKLPDKILPIFFILTCDENDDNMNEAKTIWKYEDYDLPENYYDYLNNYISELSGKIQTMICHAISGGLVYFPSVITPIIHQLDELFQESLPIERLRKKGSVNSRIGVMKVFEGFGKINDTILTSEQLNEIMNIIIIKGFGDIDDNVRITSLDCGISIIKVYGESHCEELVSTFESALESIKNEEDELIQDNQKEGTVVLLGSISAYLERSDPKIQSIFDILLSALYTPSQSVQLAVSECLTSIAKTDYVLSNSEDIINNLFETLTESDEFSQRLGAAHGIAGLLSGFGIPSLKKYDIIGRITSNFDSKKWQPKEGCLLLLECLSHMFKKKFDPYVVVVLNNLLKGFSDPSDNVRVAAKDAAEEIMSNIRYKL